jgi:hypothetical protein
VRTSVASRRPPCASGLGGAADTRWERRDAAEMTGTREEAVWRGAAVGAGIARVA